jgi:hypothetical protein
VGLEPRQTGRQADRTADPWGLRHQILGDCGTVINLWESGAAFEDFVAAAGSLVASGRRGRFFVGVDPWFLRRNVNSLWTQERDSYERSRAVLGLARDRNGLLRVGAKWLNLVSADYAVNNLLAVLTSARALRPTQVASLKLRDGRDANPDEAIMLPNGRYEPTTDAVGRHRLWVMEASGSPRKR